MINEVTIQMELNSADTNKVWKSLVLALQIQEVSNGRESDVFC